MAFVNFKINNKVMKDVANGRTPGNRLIPELEKLGRDVADRARDNTYSARNHSDGVRRTRWRSGEAGRENTGRLARSYHVQTTRGLAGAPEVRVGSYVPYFKYQEMGTSSSGWGPGVRGIMAGNMLKDAMQGMTGRNVSGFLSGMPRKLT
jgi:hypothetical protein